MAQDATNMSNSRTPEPSSNLVWALISLGFCVPLGIMDLIESVKAENLYSDRNIDAAIAASNKSKLYCLCALFFGLILIIATVIAFILNQ